MKKKLTSTQIFVIETIKKDGEMKLNKVNRNTVIALTNMGVCIYNDRYDGLKLNPSWDVSTIHP